MKIPKQIVIAGHTYDVSFVDVVTETDGGVIDAAGYWDSINMAIQILEGRRATAGVILLHEVIHAIEKHYGLKIELLEEDVDRLAKGMYDFLRNNKIRWCD